MAFCRCCVLWIFPKFHCNSSNYSSSSFNKKLYNSAANSLILICAGALPNFWFNIVTINISSRKSIQTMGFVSLIILFGVIGFTYHKIGDHILLALCILCHFFCSFSPNISVGTVQKNFSSIRYRFASHSIFAVSENTSPIVSQTTLSTLINHNYANEVKAKVPLFYVTRLFY